MKAKMKLMETIFLHESSNDNKNTYIPRNASVHVDSNSQKLTKEFLIPIIQNCHILAFGNLFYLVIVIFDLLTLRRREGFQLIMLKTRMIPNIAIEVIKNFNKWEEEGTKAENSLVSLELKTQAYTMKRNLY